MKSQDVMEDPTALYTEEEMKEMKEKFESFDIDADGGLTTKELKRCNGFIHISKSEIKRH